MKKSVIGTVPETPGVGRAEDWLDLPAIASVEVTSEDPQFPIESVFVPGAPRGWRAADGGQQVIRILFAKPQSIHRIHLEFVESEATRTQEFILRWANSSNDSVREVVRQQWNFSPNGSTSEVEDYTVAFEDVSVLELTLTPEISGGAIATLAQWLVA